MEKKLSKFYYIYFHINPITNKIFYVGQGIHSSKKFYRAFDFKKRSEFWKNVYSKYGVLVHIVEQNISESDINNREIFYIQQIGRRDLGTGPLVNLNDGGQGLKNYVCSPETKLKMSLSQIGNTNGSGNKGRKCTEEEKKKNSDWHIGKKLSEETKLKMSKPKSEKVKEKIRNSSIGRNKGKPWSEARREAQKLRTNTNG